MAADARAELLGIGEVVLDLHARQIVGERLSGNRALAWSTTASHRYCWAVWKPGHVGRPAFWWVRTADF